MRQGLGTKCLSHTPQCRKRLEERLRSDGDARIVAADSRLNKEVSEQLEGNRQVVDIQEENRVPNSGVLNGVPNNDGVLNGDNNNGIPAPTIPKLAIQCDDNGNITGRREDDDRPMLLEDDDESDMLGLLQAGCPATSPRISSTSTNYFSSKGLPEG